MKQILLLMAAMLLTCCSKDSEATAQNVGNMENISVTLSLTSGTTAIRQVRATTEQDVYYSLNGVRVEKPTHGIFIKNGKKVML